jgi:hypothetical protein
MWASDLDGHAEAPRPKSATTLDGGGRTMVHQHLAVTGLDHHSSHYDVPMVVPVFHVQSIGLGGIQLAAAVAAAVAAVALVGATEQ